jgi:hypothetical protein
VKRWQVYTGRDAVLADTEKTFSKIQEARVEKEKEKKSGINNAN